MAVADDLEFIDEADIHRPVDIFQKLGHFRRPGAGNRHDPADDLSVERRPDLKTVLPLRLRTLWEYSKWYTPDCPGLRVRVNTPERCPSRPSIPPTASRGSRTSSVVPG